LYRLIPEGTERLDLGSGKLVNVHVLAGMALQDRERFLLLLRVAELDP
jgi:hypothetical protein